MVDPSAPNASSAATIIGTLLTCGVATLVIVTAISSPSRQINSERPKQPAQRNQQPADQRTPSAESQHGTAEPDSRPTQQESEEHSNLSQTIATWVQAFAAVVSLVLTIWLIYYSHRGWEAADKNAEAAMTSAKALKVIHRQWVSVDNWTFNTWKIPNVGLQGEVTAEITNRTPLPITIFALRCYVDKSKGNYAIADKMLIPDASTHETVSFQMTDKQIAEYRASALRLVVSGWVHYWDAFGDLQNEVVGVCLEHIGPRAQPTTRGVSGLMRKMKRMEKEWPVQEMVDWMEQRDREKDEKGEW